MRNVPTYTRPRSPEILKVSLRDVGPVSILRHTPVARSLPSLTNASSNLRPRFDIKGDGYRDVVSRRGMILGILFVDVN